MYGHLLIIVKISIAPVSSRDLGLNSHGGGAYARITSASGCARSLLGKERLLATVAPPSDWTRIEVDRRKGLRTSIRLRAQPSG